MDLEADAARHIARESSRLLIAELVVVVAHRGAVFLGHAFMIAGVALGRSARRSTGVGRDRRDRVRDEARKHRRPCAGRDDGPLLG